MGVEKTLGINVKAKDGASPVLGNIISKISQLKVALPLAGAAAVSAIGYKSVKAFASFDDAMAKSTAIMGDLSDEMKEKLSKAAREVAKNTQYSATEAAEAYYYLASAGLSAQESLEMMPTVAQLAAAGNMNLAEATDVATDVMKAFGLQISDITKISDIMTNTVISSNTTMQQLGQALSFVAPIAHAAGLSLDEVSAAIGMMGDIGIKGTRAGTSLRMAIANILHPTGAAVDALKKMGLTTVDLSKTLSEKGLSGVLDLLREKMSGAGKSEEALIEAMNELGYKIKNSEDLTKALATATEEDLAKAMEIAAEKSKEATLMMDIFGVRAAPAMIGLLAEGGDALRKFAKENSDAVGKTAEVAEKQLSSATAQWDMFKHKLNDVAISIGAKIVPILLNFMHSIEGVVDWVQKLWGVFSKGDLSTVFSMLVSGAKKALERVKEIVIKILKTVVGWIKKVDWKKLWSTIVSTMKTIFSGIVSFMKNLGKQIVEKLKLIDWGKVEEKLKSAFSKIKEKLKSINWEEIGEKLKSAISKIKEKLESIDWGKVEEKLRSAFSKVKDWAKETGGKIKEAIDNVDWEGTGRKIGEKISVILKKGAEISESLSEKIEEVDWENLGKNIGEKIVGFVKAVIKKLGSLLKGVFGEGGEGENPVVAFIVGMFKLTKSITKAIGQFALGLSKALLKGIGEGLGALGSIISEKMSSMWENAKVAVENKLVDIGNIIKTKFSEFVQKIKNFGTNMVAGIKESFSNVVKIVKEKLNSVKSFISELPKLFYSIALNIGKSIYKGISNGIGNIAQIIKDKIKGAVDSVKDFLKIGSPSRVFQEIGMNITEGLKIGVGSIGSVFNDIWDKLSDLQKKKIIWRRHILPVLPPDEGIIREFKPIMGKIEKGVKIENLTIYANSSEEGRKAAEAFRLELHRRGY